MQKAEEANKNTKQIAPVVVFSKCSSNNCQLRRGLFTIIPLLLVVIFLLALGNLIMTRPQNYDPIIVATTRRKEGNSSSSKLIILGDKTSNSSSSSSPPQLKRNSSTSSPTEEEEELLTRTEKQENDTQHLLSSSTMPPQLKRNSSTSSLSEDEEELPSITRTQENDTHHLLSSSTEPQTKPRSSSSSSSWTIMTTINFAFLDFFYNWIHHYDKLNLTLDMILVAEDDITFDHLQTFRTSYYKSKYNITTTTINTTNTSTGSSNSRRGEVARGVVPDIIVERSSLKLNKKGVSTNTSFGWGEMNYKIMMSARPKLIRKKLEAGYNLIFTDVDFIWQKNPIPFFTANNKTSSSSSQMYNSMDPNKVRCGGFWACRSTPETIKFAKKWEKRLKKKGPSHNQAPFNFVINRMVRNHEIKTTQLSNKDFLNGNNMKRYNAQQRSEATALHFNMVTKFDSKKEQMIKYGYWALNDTNTGINKE